MGVACFDNGQYKSSAIRIYWKNKTNTRDRVFEALTIKKFVFSSQNQIKT